MEIQIVEYHFPFSVYLPNLLLNVWFLCFIRYRCEAEHLDLGTFFVGVGIDTYTQAEPRATMRNLGVFYYALCVLFTSTSAAAAQADEHIDTGKEECPQTPLTRESDLTCVAPQPKPKPEPKTKTTFRDGKWRWNYDDHSDDWDGPYDCIESYCVFVNPKLNDGLVLISPEPNVGVIDNFSNTKELFKHETPPFYATPIPGKGIGLIANRTIKKNEIIFHTTPAMLVQFGPHLDFDGETRLELYDRAVAHLPPTAQEHFQSQYGEDAFMKVDRNAFRLFINGERPYSGHLAVYPQVSRMNHDCRPNIHYRMDNITHISIAVRDIAPGEELTISYIDGHMSRAERQSRLGDWGFKCTCPHCSMSAEDVAASDKRMDEIYAIEDDLEKQVSAGVIIDPGLGDKLVRLYEAEKFDSYIGQALTRAALVHSLLGNEKEATSYADKAYEALAREHGEWNKDAKAMKLLAENPTKHWSWQALKKKAEREAKQKKEKEQREKKMKEKLKEQGWEEGVITDQVKVELTGGQKEKQREGSKGERVG